MSKLDWSKAKRNSYGYSEVSTSGWGQKAMKRLQAPMEESGGQGQPKRPTHVMVWTNKRTQEKFRVAALWKSEYGATVTLQRGFTSKAGNTYPGVVKLQAVLSDGTVVDATDCVMRIERTTR